MRFPRLLRFALTTSALVLMTEPAAFAQGTTTPAKKGDKPAPAAAPAKTTDQDKEKEKEKEKKAEDARWGLAADTNSKDLKELDASHAVYMTFDLAFNRTDLGGFSDTLGLDKTGANGLGYGIGAGVRLKELRIGARFHGASTTEFTLWNVMAEVGYGLPWRPLAPALWLHAGYMFDTGIQRGAFANQLPSGNVVAPDIDVNGLIVGTELTFSYYITKFLRAGPFLGFDALFVHRKQAPLPQSIFPVPAETRDNPLFSGTGSGIGYDVELGLRGAFDIAY